MFKFLHAADIHLDSPLIGLERYDGAPVDQIRQASRRALENLVQLALDEQVQFVLIAGDLYDGNWKDYNTGLFFIAQIARLREAKIPVILIAGNHDAENRMTRNLRLRGEYVTLLKHTEPESKELADVGVVIHGQSFAKKGEDRDLSERYPQAIRGLFNIGLLHTCATGAEGHERYAPCTIEGLCAKGYNYWALGHVHHGRTLHRDPPIIFSGNIQGRKINETGAKGCMLVTVDDDEEVTTEFRSLDVFRWERCVVDATGAPNGDTVMNLLSGRLTTILEQCNDLPLAVRVVMQGPSLAHDQFHSNSSKWTNEVRATANDIGAEQIWIEKVQFQTSSPKGSDLDTGDGPIGELVGLLNALRSDESQLAELGREFEDLGKKVAQVFKETDDPPRIGDPAWIRSLLDEVGPILIERLRAREDRG